MSSIRALAALTTLLLATGAVAQLPGPGLGWYGSRGNAANSYLPSCTNLQVDTAQGEPVTLVVSGDRNAPFVLLTALTATSCQPISGLGNALVLDPPIITIAIGTLTFTTPCLSCPPGYEPVGFTVPPTIPIGFALSFQAVSLGAGRLSLTVAVTATVR